MVKCKVIKTYIDKNSKEIVKENDIIEVTKTRAEELEQKGKVEIIKEDKKNNSENKK